MIKKIIIFFGFLSLLSCSNIELVLKEDSAQNIFKNRTALIVGELKQESFYEELLAFFGNNKDGDYILVVSFSENKENRLVKKNQVAEKIDYELNINYELFYKNRNCKIHNKNIVSKFSFVPKSFGYNFGADRSLEKLYKNSIKNNIKNFYLSTPINNNCI